MRQVSRWDIGPSIEYLRKTDGWLWDKPLSSDKAYCSAYLDWFKSRGWRTGWKMPRLKPYLIFPKTPP